MSNKMVVYRKIVCEKCKRIIDRQFRFTDWNNQYNDDLGNWEECKRWFDEAVNKNPKGRFSIWAVTICPYCEMLLEDDEVNSEEIKLEEEENA